MFKSFFTGCVLIGIGVQWEEKGEVMCLIAGCIAILRLELVGKCVGNKSEVE